MWGTTKRYGERSESGTGWEEWERADAEDAEAQSSLRWELEQSRKGLRAEGEELAHVTEFLVAGVEKFLDARVGEDEELALEGVTEKFGGGFVVAVGAAVGFGDDFVDNAEVLQVRGHDLHGDGRGFGFGGFAQVASDGFALAALFGVNAGIGARGVNESKNRAAEFCGEFHDAERFAVAFGLRLAEIAVDALLGVASFLVADDSYGASAKLCQAGDQRFIVTKAAVTVE